MQYFLCRMKWLGLASLLAVFPLQWIDFSSFIDLDSVANNMELGLESKLRLADLYIKAFLTASLVGIGVFLLVWPVANRLNEFGHKQQEKIRLFTIFLSFLYIAAFSIMSIQKYYAYHADADEGAWFEIFYNFYRGQLIPNSTIISPSYYNVMSPNWFSQHFVPIIYILYLPFFLFIPYPQVSFFLQTLYIASSIVPLYLLARLRWRDSLSPYMLVVVFLLYPTTQYTLLYQFEALRLSIPLLLWSFYLLHARKWGAYFLVLALALMVREEVSLVLFFLGIYILLVLKEYKIGLATAALSLTYFVVVTHVTMPYLGQGKLPETTYALFGSYGYTHVEVALNILLHPLHTVERLLSPTNCLNLFIYLLPFLLTPLFSPLTTLIAFPNLFITFISDDQTLGSYISYHTTPAVAVFFFAAIEGVRWLQNQGLFSLNPVQIRVSVTSAMLATSLCVNFLLGPSPLSRQFWDKGYKVFDFKTHNFHYSTYVVTRHNRLAERFISAIPNNSVVSAEEFFLPHLFMKKGLMVFPVLVSNNREADFVLIDKTNPRKHGSPDIQGSWSGLRNNPKYYYDLIEKRKDAWELVAQKDGYFLYRRKGSGKNALVGF